MARQVVRAGISALLSIAAAIVVAGAGCGAPRQVAAPDPSRPPRAKPSAASPPPRTRPPAADIDHDGVPDVADVDDGGSKLRTDPRRGDPDDGALPDGEATLAWPPPDPSAIAEIEARYFAADRTLWDAAERIRGLLVSRGYEDLGWYRTETGFAVATRCERIDDRGVPLSDPRFSTRIPVFRDFSLRGILRAMLSAPRGRFRVIVIAVTSDPAAIRRRTRAVDASTVEGLSADGEVRVPSTLKSLHLARHAALILFYEIAKLGDASPQMIADGLTSADHVRGSGLEIW